MTYLKRDTLNFFYFCKFMELFFLAGLSIYLIAAAIKVYPYSEVGFQSEQEMTTTAMIPLVILVTLNLFYQNLLLNLRFSINLKSRTCGLICYKYVNYLFCHCCLEKCCRDKCGKKKTNIKWFFFNILLVGTIWCV